MIPRKFNTLLSEVAVECNVSKDAVSDIFDHYWKQLKKQLENPEHLSVCVRGFGTFEIRKKQVEYMVHKYRRLIKTMKPNTYNKYAMLHEMSTKLEQLEKILVKCKEQELKKKHIREIQKNGKTV